MRVVVFGLGSVGKRHVGVLNQVRKDIEIFRFRRMDAIELIPGYESIKNISSWAELESLKPDFAIISSPTPFHVEQSLTCARLGIPIFIEKPISVKLDGIVELIAEVNSRKLASYVAYPFRHHRDIGEIKTKYGKRKKLTSRIVCHTDSQRWPSKRNPDHVLFELSHEIDYAEYCFGIINQIYGSFTDQSASILLIHENNNETCVSLNMSCPTERREISIRERGVISKYIIKKSDEMYIDQMRYWIAHLGNHAMMNNVADASKLFEKIVRFKEGKLGHTRDDMRERWKQGTSREKYTSTIREAARIVDH